MNWDPFQRDALEAMGLRLYAVQGAQAGTAARGDRPRAVAQSGPEAAAAGTGDDPLLHALLRACGRRVDDAEALAFCRSLVPPGGLREASTRRALWPRLRALRSRSSR